MSEAQASPSPFALRSIYLRTANIRMVEDFDPLLPGQSLHALFRAAPHFQFIHRVATAPDGTQVPSAVFVLRFEFKYTKTPVDLTKIDGQSEAALVDDGNLIAELMAEVAIDYQLLAPEMPKEAQLQAWGQGNAVLHAWPYWREFCHSAMIRMNLPVTLIPMMQIPTLQSAKTQNGKGGNSPRAQKSKPAKSRK